MANATTNTDGLFIPIDGRTRRVRPKFDLWELEDLYALVGSPIEIVHLRRGRFGDWILVVDEEGKLRHDPINLRATRLAQLPDDFIVGDALLLPKGVIS